MFDWAAKAKPTCNGSIDSMEPLENGTSCTMCLIITWLFTWRYPCIHHPTNTKRPSMILIHDSISIPVSHIDELGIVHLGGFVPYAATAP